MSFPFPIFPPVAPLPPGTFCPIPSMPPHPQISFSMVVIATYKYVFTHACYFCVCMYFYVQIYKYNLLSLFMLSEYISFRADHSVLDN